jgi:hypothetical protein
MVAGFAEVPDRKENRGCGGLQPSELFSAAIQRGTDPARRIGGTAKVNGHEAGDSVQPTRPNFGHASQYKRVFPVLMQWSVSPR